MPRGLSAAEVKRLLVGCDPEAMVGPRDHVVLSLLTRLRLHGAEAVDLQLSDVDWRPAKVAITGAREALVDDCPLRVEGGVRDRGGRPGN
jgi:integrase